MNPLARLLGYSALLLVVFLATALAAQSWLQRQTDRLRAEAIDTKHQQFLRTVALVTPAGAPTDAAALRRVAEAIGATIRPASEVFTTKPSDAVTLLSFNEKLSGIPSVRVTFALPPGSRLLGSQQRLALGLLLLVALIVSIVILLVILPSRPTAPGSTVTPWSATRADMGSLEHLAKTSAAQSAALHDERDSRRRAEEDLALKGQELNRSLEEKIRLGRDLHDGMIQSLYALGLTLESVRALIRTDPTEAGERLAQCATALNLTIREVRAHITGLAPDELQRAGFAGALEASLFELRAGRSVSFDIKIDEDAALLLSPTQTTATLQIAREAVSNALRHGGASLINLRMHQNETEVCLLVQDNGTGFDATRRQGEGHGLGNMQARAARMGATLRLTSQVGHGARIVLTIPASTSVIS
ncbi:MAG: sensor histidine kinase [Undibacterium sp.]|nr:sensor histidine kinase [Opitutaceae bacterium]